MKKLDLKLEMETLIQIEIMECLSHVTQDCLFTLTKRRFALFNKILGFEYALPQGIADYTSIYNQLDQFIKSMDGIYINNSKKYAVWKKLSQAPNLEDPIRIIFK